MDLVGDTQKVTLLHSKLRGLLSYGLHVIYHFIEPFGLRTEKEKRLKRLRAPTEIRANPIHAETPQNQVSGKIFLSPPAAAA